MPAFVSQANGSTPAAQPPPTLLLVKRLTASMPQSRSEAATWTRDAGRDHHDLRPVPVRRSLVRPAAGPPPPVSGLTRLLIRTQEVQYGQYPAIAVGGGQVQLGEDRVDVLGHGAVADHERRRDVAV